MKIRKTLSVIMMLIIILFISICPINVYAFSTNIEKEVDTSQDEYMENVSNKRIADLKQIFIDGEFCSTNCWKTTSNLIRGIEDNGAVPYEQGPYWQYGGKFAYNKYFANLTRVLVLTWLVGILIPIDYAGAIATQIINAGLDSNDIDVTVVVTCYYRQITPLHIEHNHICESYKKGQYVSTVSYTFYDSEVGHPWFN